jgi:putative PIN family toxin of toxin-antitoxin system
MRIVLDTNVLVSGLLNPDGAPGRLLDLILVGELQVLYDDRILAEYSDVLERPQFSFPPDLTRLIVGYFRLFGESVTALPLPFESLPDPDDNPFSGVAISGNADMLVTGNQRHFADRRHFAGLEAHGVNVLSPDALLEILRKQQGQHDSPQT